MRRCALGTSAADLRGFEARALVAPRAAEGQGRPEGYSAGVAAYVYGLAPLSVRGTVPRFPRNQIVSIGELVEPDVRTVVSPNVDTTYTVGQIDLSDGPLVVDVPDTQGRYYVLQFMDAYSNTFSYIGRRTTGTKPGSYVLVPPGYSGALPAGRQGDPQPHEPDLADRPHPREGRRRPAGRHRADARLHAHAARLPGPPASAPARSCCPPSRRC